MKEYAIEDGEGFNQEELKSSKMEKANYIEAHKNLPIVCHDVFIEYKGGILMVVRDNVPAKGELWCIGGRVNRGMSMEKSLKKKTKEECGLELSNIKELGVARTFFKSDPFNHGKGTDTPAFVYFAKGEGELKLDNLHKEPIIVKPSDYPAIRPKLHPYIRDFMDKAIALIN